MLQYDSVRDTIDLYVAEVILAITGFQFAMIALVPRIPFLPGHLSIHPGLGVPPVVGLLFGIPGAIGAGLGYGVAAAMSGGLGANELLNIGASILFGFSAYRLWGSVSTVSSGEPPGIRSAAGLVEFLAVGTLAIIVVTPLIAWGDAITGSRPFFVGAAVTLATYVASVVVFGLPFLMVAGPMLRERGLTKPTPRNPAPGWVPVLGLTWIVIGTVASIGFRLFALVPNREYLVRDLGFLLVLENRPVFGYLGSRVQLVLDAMFLTAIVLALSLGMWVRSA